MAWYSERRFDNGRILKDDSTEAIRLWRGILKVDSSDICRVSKTLLLLLNVVKTFSKIHLKADFFNLGLSPLGTVLYNGFLRLVSGFGHSGALESILKEKF